MRSSVFWWVVLAGVCSFLLSLFFMLYDNTQENIETQQNVTQVDATGISVDSAGSVHVENGRIEASEPLSETCHVFAKKLQLTEHNKALGLELIRQYLRSVKIEFDHLDAVFHLAEIDLLTGRKLSSDYSHTFRAPPYFPSETTFAKHEAAIIDELIELRDAAGLTQAISEERFNNYAYWGGENFLVFVSAYIIQTQEKPAAEQLLPKLLLAGIVPHYSDLVIAGQFHIDINIIKDMFASGRLQPDITLSYLGVKSSLLVMALLADNYEAAQLWLELDSPIEPDHYAPNALDYLFHRQSHYSEAQVRELALEMLKKGASPNHSKTEEKLTKILTDNEVTMFAGQLSPNNRLVLSEAEKVKVDSVLAQLYDMSWALLGKKHEKASFEHCREQVAKQLFQQLAKSYESNNDNTAKSSSQFNPDKVQNEEAMIKKVLSQFPNQDEAEQALTMRRKGIEAKQLVEKYRLALVNEKVRKELEEHGVDPDNSEDYALTDTDKLVLKMQQLAAQGQWNDALILAEQLHVVKEDAYPLLFGLGLLHSAPWELFESLLDKGTQVPANAILILTITDNVNLVELLLPFELDLNFRDDFGYSAIANSVLNRAPNLLSFLLNKGVSVNETSKGFDALDFALRDFSVKKNNALYVEMLIKAGAKIKTSHKQWVEDKFQTDLESYSYLVSYFPALVP